MIIVKASVHYNYIHVTQLMIYYLSVDISTPPTTPWSGYHKYTPQLGGLEGSLTGTFRPPPCRLCSQRIPGRFPHRFSTTKQTPTIQWNRTCSQQGNILLSYLCTYNQNAAWEESMVYLPYPLASIRVPSKSFLKSIRGKKASASHLSSPEGSSINDGIHSLPCSMYYVSVQDAMMEISKLEKEALMAKFDIKDA